MTVGLLAGSADDLLPPERFPAWQMGRCLICRTPDVFVHPGEGGCVACRQAQAARRLCDLIHAASPARARDRAAA